MQKIINTARALVAGDKGLLAMDESTLTCNQRFYRLGISQAEEVRRAWRELIGECISGVIFYDETIRQHTKQGNSFVKVLADAGIISVIKVDTGAKDMAGHPGEKITEGLDGLRDRLNEYFQMGARFCKWRVVIAVGDGIPGRGCIEANAHALARYAAPFPYLGIVGETLMGSGIALGAQNLFPEKEGAFTGEVSPTMLLDLGCQYVILGHSERRHKLGESDEFINHKVRVALAAGLYVIFCVGETLGQREANQTEMVLDQQLIQGLAGLSVDTLSHLSIAYEPVWAIGSHGHQATPQQAQEEHAVIRHRFGQMFGEHSALALAIHYGGSVSPENAAELFSQQGVDGVLIGADSLNASQFLAIVQAGIHAPQTEGRKA
jgi:triosephosphate isomerase